MVSTNKRASERERERKKERKKCVCCDNCITVQDQRRMILDKSIGNAEHFVERSQVFDPVVGYDNHQILCMKSLCSVD